MDGLPYHYKHPHAAITTDSVVFGFDGKRLHVLLIERGLEPYKGQWALPGGFLNLSLNETLEECAVRELREETGVKDIYLEQFHAFSAVDRDPRERVVTVAFFALVSKDNFRLIGGDDAADARWFAADRLPELAFDHREIIDLAKEALQVKLRTAPIAFRLLNERFIMSELQGIYESIYGHTFDRRNFAKKMLATGFLKDVTPPETRTSNRIPLVYEFDGAAFTDYVKKTGRRKYPFDF